MEKRVVEKCCAFLATTTQDLFTARTGSMRKAYLTQLHICSCHIAQNPMRDDGGEEIKNGVRKGDCSEAGFRESTRR